MQLLLWVEEGQLRKEVYLVPDWQECLLVAVGGSDQFAGLIQRVSGHTKTLTSLKHCQFRIKSSARQQRAHIPSLPPTTRPWFPSPPRFIPRRFVLSRHGKSAPTQVVGRGRVLFCRKWGIDHKKNIQTANPVPNISPIPVRPRGVDTMN